MPRKSRAELAIVPIRAHHRRISPPAGMSPEETALFKEIVEAAPAMHFTQSDGTLLRAYVQGCLLLEKAFEAAQASPSMLPDWERCARVVASLATKLRLSVQSRVDPKSLTRAVLGTAMREGLTPESLVALRDGTARGWKVRG